MSSELFAIGTLYFDLFKYQLNKMRLVAEYDFTVKIKMHVRRTESEVWKEIIIIFKLCSEYNFRLAAISL